MNYYLHYSSSKYCFAIVTRLLKIASCLVEKLDITIIATTAVIIIATIIVS